MQLRIAGASFAAIATELGYADRKGAERAVIAGLRAYFREPANDLLPLELDRLDRLQLAIWQQAMDGNVQAVLAVLRIMERRARYAGLDAPVNVNAKIASHQQLDVNLNALVIPADLDSPTYLAVLRAIRGEGPTQMEGSSSIVEDGPTPSVSQPPDT
jgi:hypothetical protein